MTKAEQKKKASQEKHAFITAAAQIIPRKALDLLCGSRLNLKVNLTVKNQNCYFNLHRFYKDFNVQIYRSGDIDVSSEISFITKSRSVLYSLKRLSRIMKKPSDNLKKILRF